jgi:hypothetical protein
MGLARSVISRRSHQIGRMWNNKNAAPTYRAEPRTDLWCVGNGNGPTDQRGKLKEAVSM